MKEQEKDELLQLLEIKNLEINLADYIKEVWKIIEPETEYKHNWHIDLICEYLQTITDGDLKRLIINIPFRYSKSLLVSVFWPTWEWITKPENRWFFASYSQDLATDLSIKRRRIIQSEWFQRRWGSYWKIMTDQNIKTWFENDKTGVMVATGAGGSITGRGGNRLVVDDPLQAIEAMSETKRKFINNWFDQEFYNRLNDKQKDAVVIIHHRLHSEDLTGHLAKKKLEEEYKYTILSLPMVAEKKTAITFPISGKEFIRKEGHLLWKEKDGIKEVESYKELMGMQGFKAQCQQNPEDIEGIKVKREWWKYYRELPNCDYIYQSWDTAIKKKDENAYSVCITMAENDRGYYILDVWRKKVEVPELRKVARQLYEKYKPFLILVEDKVSGTGLIQELDRESKIPVKPVNPIGDKITRLNLVLPLIEAGKVYLQESGSWAMDFIEEFASAPNGQYFDQIDAFTQLLLYIADKRKHEQAVFESQTITFNQALQVVNLENIFS